MARLPTTLQTVWDGRFMGWHLAPGHPTDPRRAVICREILKGIDLPVAEHSLEELPYDHIDDMMSVHDGDYVEKLLNGYNDEWEGKNLGLASVAQLMFAATMAQARSVIKRRQFPGNMPLVYWNPMGAKHHAMPAKGSGFCALNDMAAAAKLMVRSGLRVAYLDWDVHHGDGVEWITYHDSQILTYSIHQAGKGFFPGTGLDSESLEHVYNAPLLAGMGDLELIANVNHALVCIRAFAPDVIFLAAGADGLEGDPLGGLEYTIPGLARAGRKVGELARELGIPVLIGGAGGYQPLTNTPRAWAAVVAAVWAAHNGIALNGVTRSA